MVKAAALGLVALTTCMGSLASAQQWGATSPAAAAVAPRIDPLAAPARASVLPRDRARTEAPDAIITEAHIARLRSTLKLSAAQMPHWMPVEAALSELARQQARGEAAGFGHNFTDRSSAIAATAAQLRRLRAIAMPLIRTLDDNQKHAAISFARNLGFQQLVAAF